MGIWRAAVSLFTLALPHSPSELLGIDYIEHKTVDIKRASQLFLRDNARSLHHFEDVRELVNGQTHAYCLWHHQRCAVLAEAKPHVVVAGPPCRPFSVQRGCRGRQQSAPQTCPPTKSDLSSVDVVAASASHALCFCCLLCSRQWLKRDMQALSPL